MTPIKLDDFLTSTAPKAPKGAINLLDFGLYHAAPQEDGQRVLDMRFDAKIGGLVPVEH